MLRSARTLLASLLLGIGASPLYAQAVTEFDLPAQPLAESLKALGIQAKLNVVSKPSLVDGRQAPALKGTVTPQQALTHLLANTDLEYQFVNEQTVVIRSAQASASARREARKNEGQERPLALARAQAQNPSPSEGQGQGEDAQRVQSPQVTELEEIVVTGSHIRGRANNTVPMVVMDRQYIEATGQSTVGRLMESLPQNLASINPSVVSGTPGTGNMNTTNQGSSVNLRGLGPGATLTLLNGRRMALGFGGTAVDISALPLSAIERVEILTNGASALYGSDAIGGVVNFVLRDDYEGAETRLRAGWADGMGEQRVSQLLGNTWNSGNVLASFEYYTRDLLLADDRDFVPKTEGVGSLLPEDENYSGLLSGRQSLTEELTVFADALYTKRNSFNFGGRTDVNTDYRIDNPQLNASLGLDWRVGEAWKVTSVLGYGRNKILSRSNELDQSSDTLFQIRSAQVKADGPIFEMPGGAVGIAIGGEWRSEKIEDSVELASTGVSLREFDVDQIVRSAFAEAYVPLVGPQNGRTGVQRLELSLSGRYDEYSNFGSSFDTQIGFMWEPVSGLRIRGSRGTAYKGPLLFNYVTSGNTVFALFDSDAGVPAGFSHQLWAQGNDAAALSAEESRSFSLGVEFVPQAISGMQIGINYFEIDYSNRIASPGNTSVLIANPDAFAGLVVRNPTVEQVNELIAFGLAGAGFFPFDIDFNDDPNFTPESIELILDIRTRNLSAVRTSGFDATISYETEVGDGSLHMDLSGTHVAKLEQKLTSTSPTFATVDTIYNPPDWRLRAALGWQLHGWTSNLSVSFSDSYLDSRLTPRRSISSFTVVDARVAYDFRKRTASGVLAGVTLAAYAQNLLDREPPRTNFVGDNWDLGFDPVNASPLGRFVGVELTKSW